MNRSDSLQGHENEAIRTRDQARALHAYKAVSEVRGGERQDYRAVVNDLGANILRGGLCAALAAVQRRGEGGKRLIEHLAGAQVPGLEGIPGSQLAERVRGLDAGAYMAATREMLQVAAWLKRAAQATFGED